MSSSAPSNLTVQNISEMLGIDITQQISRMLSEEADSFVKSIIEDLFHLITCQKAPSLTSQHVNTVLKSKGLDPLLGYRISAPDYSNRCVLEQSEVLSPISLDAPLQQICKTKNLLTSHPHFLPYRYVLVEGVSTSKKAQSKRSSSRHSRPPDRAPISASISASTSALSLSSISVEGLDSSHQKISDVLSEIHQLFFLRSISLLRNDSANSAESVVYTLSTALGIEPLLPYFIQFIFGQSILHFHDYGIMQLLTKLELAILSNPSLNVSLYCIPLSKLPLGLLCSDDVGAVENGYDFDLRDTGATMLKLLIERCGKAFPGMVITLFNIFIGFIFNTAVPLEAHYGAFLGIRTIGCFRKLAPHLCSYLKLLRTVFEQSSATKWDSAEKILTLLEESATEVNDPLRGKILCTIRSIEIP